MIESRRRDAARQSWPDFADACPSNVQLGLWLNGL
jgi:hypothetical protein